MSSSLSPSPRNPGPFTGSGSVTPLQNRRNTPPSYSHPVSSDASLGFQDEFANGPDSTFPDRNSLPPSHASRHGISARGPFADDPSTDSEDGNPIPRHSLDLSQDLQDTNSLRSRPSVRETYRTNDAHGARFAPRGDKGPSRFRQSTASNGQAVHNNSSLDNSRSNANSSQGRRNVGTLTPRPSINPRTLAALDENYDEDENGDENEQAIQNSRNQGSAQFAACQNERLRHVWPSNSFKKPVLAGWPTAENTSTNLNRSRELTTSQGLQLPGSNLIRSRAYASTANETHGPDNDEYLDISTDSQTFEPSVESSPSARHAAPQDTETSSTGPPSYTGRAFQDASPISYIGENDHFRRPARGPNPSQGPDHPSFASIDDFSTVPTRRPNSVPPALSRPALPTSSTSLSNNSRTPSRAGLPTNPYDDANDDNGGPNDDYTPASQRPRAAPRAPSNRAHNRPTGFPGPAQAGSPRASPNASIAVIVRAPDGSELEFRLKRSTPLGKMMASLRARKRLGGGVRFVFEGVRVLEGSTCQSLDIVDGDLVETYVEQIGGGAEGSEW